MIEDDIQGIKNIYKDICIPEKLRDVVLESIEQGKKSCDHIDDSNIIKDGAYRYNTRL